MDLLKKCYREGFTSGFLTAKPTLDGTHVANSDFQERVLQYWEHFLSLHQHDEVDMEYVYVNGYKDAYIASSEDMDESDRDKPYMNKRTHDAWGNSQSYRRTMDARSMAMSLVNIAGKMEAG